MQPLAPLNPTDVPAPVPVATVAPGPANTATLGSASQPSDNTGQVQSSDVVTTVLSGEPGIPVVTERSPGASPPLDAITQTGLPPGVILSTEGIQQPPGATFTTGGLPQPPGVTAPPGGLPPGLPLPPGVTLPPGLPLPPGLIPGPGFTLPPNGTLPNGTNGGDVIFPSAADILFGEIMDTLNSVSDTADLVSDRGDPGKINHLYSMNPALIL